jgi:hypothetical protein
LRRSEIPVLEIRHQALGKNNGTRITIVQRQDGEAFDIDLDLRITTGSGSEIRSVSINQKEFSFVIKSDSVTEITPDPDTRLLFIPYTVTAPDKF